MPSAVLELLGQVANRLLVQGGLFAAERAEGRHLDLIGQVGDDSLVGLQPAQDVRPDQRAERLVRRPGLHLLDQAGERLGAAEQARVEEIEQRPEVGQAVLDRRSRHGDAGRRLQLLDRPRLPRARVLDRLGFVEDHKVPVAFLEPLGARQHAVGCDQEIQVLERLLLDFALGRWRSPTGGRSGTRARVRTARARPSSSRAARPARPAGSASPAASRWLRGLDLRCSKRPMTCTVFPRPMSSARHAPRPSPVTNLSQLTPVC